MTVRHLEVLVEEPSMEAALQLLIPKILNPKITFSLHPHRGKPDLLGKLPSKFQAYAKWLDANSRVLVVVDRDDDDCAKLKSKILSMAKKASLTTAGNRRTVAARIAVEELEAWYFGDWNAVQRAYPRVPPNVHVKAPYRDADAIAGGTWEAFERVLKKAGYFATGLRKVEAARAVATEMIPAQNSSTSFQALKNLIASL